MMNNLLNRISTPWGFSRWLYLVMGVIIIIQGAVANQVMGLILGSYFSIMAVFGIGCAMGNCYVPRSTKRAEVPDDIEFTEIR